MTDEKSSGEGRELLLMAGAGWVQAIDTSSGEIAWLLNLESPKPMTPSVGVVDGKVVIATSGQIYCVDHASGKKLWQRPCLGASSRPTLLIDEGKIYLAGRSRSECFNLEGKQLWSASSPAMTGGYVALATKNAAAQADVS